MIASFADKDTALIFDGRRARRILADIARTARRKLLAIDAAISVADLRVPPGNRLDSSAAVAPRSTRSGSTTNGASPSPGMTAPRMTC